VDGRAGFGGFQLLAHPQFSPQTRPRRRHQGDGAPLQPRQAAAIDGEMGEI